MKKVVSISIVSAIALAWGIAEARTEADESLPEGLRGFSGQVRGVVVRKGEKNTFDFNVARVLRILKDNRAEAPESIAGRTVPVGPRWTKGEDGKWHPVERHAAFIRGLKPGQEITLEIRNVEHSHFSILELSEDQRKLAGQKHAERKTATDRKPEGEIQELRREIQRLKKEVAELRRLLEKKGD